MQSFNIDPFLSAVFKNYPLTTRFNEKVLVIIPTYNESQNIYQLIDEVLSVENAKIDILVVDDNSPDKTSEKVEDAQKKWKNRVNLIKRNYRNGLGTAYVTGFKYAIEKSYDVLFEMDADFSHSPQMIPYFLEALKGSDAVIGSRYLGNIANVVNWPISRLILSKTASLYTRIITGMPIKDPTSGFKCFKVDILKSLNLENIKSSGYSFQIEVNFKLWKKGFRLVEIPILFVDRIIGSSKMNSKVVIEAIIAVWYMKLKSIFQSYTFCI